MYTKCEAIIIASHLVKILEPKITVQELDVLHVSLKVVARLHYWLGRTL